MNIKVLDHDSLQARLGVAEPHAPTAMLHEVFAESRDGAGLGFVFAMAGRKARAGRPILWVQERMALLEGGVPSVRGLAGWTVPDGLIRVRARNGTDLLWAMEEGLRCQNLSAVIGEIWGEAQALDFTATRRLAMRARANGVPAYLLRVAASPGLSAAGERWRIKALPSTVHPYNRKAPGDPRWALEMFRARWQRPGAWVGRYDRAAHRLDLSARAGDGAVADHQRNAARTG
ncbi:MULTISPECIES: hypothetical protein [unclassified Roseitalea]|uniref:ImuA family protein n=1 Tax=unclassified Roseitalea TaxID=2639107 RepID=UPI00273D4B55|nr:MULTISPECIES: hypothetical protein [unclassified Roseitalea]